MRFELTVVIRDVCVACYFVIIRILFSTAGIFIAVAAFFVVANWWTQRRPLQRSARDVQDILAEFLAGSGGAYDWYDFLLFPIADPKLDAIRARCNVVDWMTDEGKAEIRRESERLRGGYL